MFSRPIASSWPPFSRSTNVSLFTRAIPNWMPRAASSCRRLASASTAVRSISELASALSTNQRTGTGFSSMDLIARARKFSALAKNSGAS